MSPRGKALGRCRPWRRSTSYAWPPALVLALLARAPAAAAELPVSPPSPAAGSVAMWPPLCGGEGFWLVSFLDSLRVELAGKRLACCEIVEAGQVPSPNATVHLKIELLPCTPDADRVRVLVSEPARAATAEREIGLADVKETARPRALALAVAELLRSLGQSASAAKAEAPPAAAETGTGAPPVESRRAAALSVHVDAEVRGFPTRDTLLWGGRAGFAAGWGWLHARLDAGGGFASARVDSGDVLLRTLSAGLGVGPRFAARSAILDLGLRAELGWIWVRGESGMAFVRTGAGSDFCATAALRASVEAPARVRARPRVTLEGGGVLRGVKAQANGVTVAGITGYYLLAAVGVAISL